MHIALRWAQEVSFTGLALVSLYSWWRRRSRAAAWAAATFCILALVVILATIAPPGNRPEQWYVKGVLVLLLLVPYALHRFMNAMVHPPRWVPLGGLTITVIVVVSTLLLPHLPARDAPRPLWLNGYLFLLLLQWTALTLSTSIRLWLAGRRQPGVPRRRMRLLAVAALGLDVVVVVSAQRQQNPGPDGLTILLEILGLLVGGLLYLAFAPPRTLRNAWRSREQQALQRASKGMSAATSMHQVTDALLPHVAPLFGGNAAALTDREGRLLGVYGMEAAEAERVLARKPPGIGAQLESGFVVLQTGGGRLLVRVSAFTPMFGRDDLEDLGAIGEYIDLALDRVSLFEAERRSRVELEATNQALRVARDEALQASQLKSAFLANMSHEIRTPMNAVIGMTSVLLDSDLPPAQQEYAETIRTAGETLLEIINGILDLSKIEAGRLSLESMAFDLRVVFEEVVELLAQRASDKDVELTALVDAGLPALLRGDPGRVRQVLVNLVGNAVKFTDHGDVALRATAESRGPGSVTLRCEVSDTGIGIAAADCKRLFEPFYQADTSDTRTQGGTGLGLAISSQLVGLMGGTMGVESTPGAGSRFWFTVTLGHGGEPAPAIPGLPPGSRVLVADDRATSRAMLEGHLRSWGLDVSLVDSAMAAIGLLHAAVAEGNPFDAALVDLDMPGMDGRALGRVVRAHPQLAGTRLVIMASGRLDAAAFSDLSPDAVLAKPVRQSRLWDCLTTVLSTTQPPPPAAASQQRLPRGAPFPGTRVLVVEDNPVNQKVATMMLEKLGYRTDVAADGLEAVRALSLVPYAAVLMDCQMPHMDGYRATAAIRRAEDGRTRTPIIAMTASAMEGDRERCLAAGMDDYISKPVRPGEVAAALRRWTGTFVGAGGPPA